MPFDALVEVLVAMAREQIGRVGVDGRSTDEWYGTGSSGGCFVYKDSTFRKWIRADDSGDLPAESGRYHLYVSLVCPWTGSENR